ncbi:MAG TPA: hypothetical protein VMU30_02265, partial [Bacteroidota bacterium]|nr:hypothetical protein [Bacteroidota bacterium]
KVGAGYNLGVPVLRLGTNFTENYYNTSSTSYTTETNEGVYDSFGKGMGFDGALGYTGETFGFEVGVQYKPTSSIELQSFENSYYSSSTSLETYTDNLKSSMLAISPCFVFRTDIGFYGRAGIVLGFPQLTNEVKDESNGSNPSTSEYTSEYTGDMALGYTGAFGMAVGSGGLKLFVEANFVNLTWAPTKIEITAYKVNGVDQLSTLSPSNRVTHLEDSYTTDSRSSASSDQEGVGLKQYLPFSSLGLRAGIVIGF